MNHEIIGNTQAQILGFHYQKTKNNKSKFLLFMCGIDSKLSLHKNIKTGKKTSPSQMMCMSFSMLSISVGLAFSFFFFCLGSKIDAF